MNSPSELHKKCAVTIFASGNGSNAENCMIYFKNHPDVFINYTITNNANAGVIQRAEKHNVPVKIFTKQEWSDTKSVIKFLKDHSTCLIILAGFLKLIPPEIIHSFKKRIINIHPALLPAYGGKGMYGKQIHEKVIANKENYTGITIHYVDEYYDNGEIILQKQFAITPNDDASSVEGKIRQLEFEWLPIVIEQKAREGRE